MEHVGYGPLGDTALGAQGAASGTDQNRTALELLEMQV